MSGYSRRQGKYAALTEPGTLGFVSPVLKLVVRIMFDMYGTPGFFCLILVGFCAVSAAQSNEKAPSREQQAQAAAQVPVMDGGAGPCSVELTVLGSDGKPIYDATVKVRIAYGFAGTRRLDLQAGTNADGKVKFTGIPARVHRPPLEFNATKDQLEGSVVYDPTSECQAKHDLTLKKPKPQEP